MYFCVKMHPNFTRKFLEKYCKPVINTYIESDFKVALQRKYYFVHINIVLYSWKLRKYKFWIISNILQTIGKKYKITLLKRTVLGLMNSGSCLSTAKVCSGISVITGNEKQVNII